MANMLKHKQVLILCVCVLVSHAWALHLPERSELHSEAKESDGQSAAGHAIEQRDTKSYDTPSDVTLSHDTVSETAGTPAGGGDGDRKKRELSDWLIAPNTAWCGRGNLANGTYNILGGANAADKCCRKHDHCQLYIPAMSSRYELFNYRPYTLSHCNCDRRFRTCLKMANDEDAKTIGKLFFNMVQTQCFILKTEKVCQQRADDGTCLQEHVKQKAYLKNNRKF